MSVPPGYALAGRLVASVRTRSAWNPGSTDISREKLRMSRPPAASSTTASANCAVTSVPNSRRCRIPARTAASPFLQRLIGATPRRFPGREQAAQKRRQHRDAKREPQHAAVDADFRRSRNRRRRHADQDARSPPREQHAQRTAADREQCRFRPASAGSGGRGPRRARPEPPSRAPREAARVSIRLAMSAHAIRRTTPTATSSTYSVVSMRPTVSSRIGVADADRLNPRIAAG